MHNYIEETRALLREQNKDLAEREREQALALLDNAIEKVVPHINGQITIETVISASATPAIVMTVEEWQARMKGCQVLVTSWTAKPNSSEWMRRSKSKPPRRGAGN